jgi:glycosyltransferase involved in cell wall biosynthesis
MRIGIGVSFLRKPGTGIGQVTTNFLKKFVEYQISDIKYQNLNVVLYCEEEPRLDFELPENFRIRAFLPFWKRDDVPRRMLWERELSKRAQEDGCDVFLSLSQSSTSFVGYKLKTESYKLPRHIMVVHDVIPRLFPDYLGTLMRKLHWRSVEQGIRNADRIVAVSEKTKADIVSTLGVPAERISVAYPDCASVFRSGVGAEEIGRVMKKYALEPGYIYHGGGLEVRKNAERLIRAYAELRESRKNSPMLVISGKVFPASNRLATDVRGLVRELGLEESVVVLGFVPEEDLPALYHGAAFFAYPSLYEGFGLPILEAFVSGTPVLAGRAGSVPELAGDAALLVDPESVETIRRGMEQLLDDATLRGSLSEKGRTRANDFSWNTFTEKICGHFTV